jgi:hypothetical protein
MGWDDKPENQKQTRKPKRIFDVAPFRGRAYISVRLSVRAISFAVPRQSPLPRPLRQDRVLILRQAQTG